MENFIVTRPHGQRLAEDTSTEAEGAIEALRSRVRKHMIASGSGWREQVVLFGNEHSFLDMSLRKDAGHPRLLLEYGYQNEEVRRIHGFVDALWDVVDRDFREFLAVCHEGRNVDLVEAVMWATPFFDLPVIGSEIATVA